MSEETDKLRERLAELEGEVAALKRTRIPFGKRWRSSTTLFGLPLVDIAVGPDPEKGEMRGHARGVIAIGDVATGFLAVGGLAMGGVAVGGLAIGLFALGGAAVGLLLAFGGAAVGGVAIGGGAVGYYALGGGALGEHVLSGNQQDPEAVRFFGQFLPDFLLPPTAR